MLSARRVVLLCNHATPVRCPPACFLAGAPLRSWLQAELGRQRERNARMKHELAEQAEAAEAAAQAEELEQAALAAARARIAELEAAAQQAEQERAQLAEQVQQTQQAAAEAESALQVRVAWTGRERGCAQCWPGLASTGRALPAMDGCGSIEPPDSSDGFAALLSVSLAGGCAAAVGHCGGPAG